MILLVWNVKHHYSIKEERLITVFSRAWDAQKFMIHKVGFKKIQIWNRVLIWDIRSKFELYLTIIMPILVALYQKKKYLTKNFINVTVYLKSVWNVR